ncbi:hypothetical protein D3C87_1882560 [compost metagenome]
MLDLEALSDVAPVKPKPEAELVAADGVEEAPVATAKSKRPKPAVASEAAPEPAPAPEDDTPKRRSAVPRVPKKK